MLDLSRSWSIKITEGTGDYDNSSLVQFGAEVWALLMNGVTGALFGVRETGTANWKGKHAGCGSPLSGFLKLCTVLLGMLQGHGPPGAVLGHTVGKVGLPPRGGRRVFLEIFLCFAFSIHTHSLWSGSKDQVVCTTVTVVISVRRDPPCAKVVKSPQLSAEERGSESCGGRA